MTTETSFDDTVAEEFAGMRLDVFLAERIEDASRSFVKKIVKDGRVTVNGAVCKRPARGMSEGDEVIAAIPPPPSIDLVPEPVDFDIAYEDTDLVIVNKPSGLVVHPAPGHYTGTLVHGLLHRCPDFQGTGLDPVRPGIVHRLDRFTSGLMVVAKTPKAFAGLSRQVRDHAFDRRYIALVRGEFEENTGRINAAIGRSTADRARMSITGVRSREAMTRFEVLERLGTASLLALQLETGRTHQIRVHLRFVGRPVLGDPVYGVTDFSHWAVSEPARAALRALEGQALHAERLGLKHPVTGKALLFTTPPPPDFQAVLDALRGEATGG